MKFIKGIYLFSEEEIKRLTESFNKNETVEYNGKKYFPLYCIKKSSDILNVESFIEAIKKYKKKNEICKELNTTYFKLSKFMKAHYNTDDINEIRQGL